MYEDIRSAIVPESIVEFWLLRELICSYQHRAEESLDFVFLGLDWIHIHLILSVVGSELDDIILMGYDIFEFILIEQSLNGRERLSPFFSDLGRDGNMFTSRE